MFYFCADVVLGMVIYCVLFAAVSIYILFSVFEIIQWLELLIELQALTLGRLWWCLISVLHMIPVLILCHGGLINQRI